MIITDIRDEDAPVHFLYRDDLDEKAAAFIWQLIVKLDISRDRARDLLEKVLLIHDLIYPPPPLPPGWRRIILETDAPEPERIQLPTGLAGRRGFFPADLEAHLQALKEERDRRLIEACNAIAEQRRRI
jgi:hypothetical protein